MSLKNVLLTLILLVPVIAFAEMPGDSILAKYQKNKKPITHIYPIKRTELGVDVSSFVKNFLPFNTSSLLDQSLTFANFILGVKIIDSRGWALRTGLNFSARSAQGEFFPVGTRRITVAARVGFERQKYLGKHHILYTGADVAFKYERGETTEDVSNSSDLQYSTGFGLSWVGGYNYRINQWLSVGTEMSVGLSANQIVRQSFNGGFPTSNFKDKSTEGNLLINLPTSIYVNFIF